MAGKPMAGRKDTGRKESRPQAERTDGPLDEGNYQGAEEAIEDCIDDMLDGNGMCQLYLYEEGVKDGIRLMKMIRDM